MAQFTHLLRTHLVDPAFVCTKIAVQSLRPNSKTQMHGCPTPIEGSTGPIISHASTIVEPFFACLRPTIRTAALRFHYEDILPKVETS